MKLLIRAITTMVAMVMVLMIGNTPWRVLGKDGDLELHRSGSAVSSTTYSLCDLQQLIL